MTFWCAGLDETALQSHPNLHHLYKETDDRLVCRFGWDSSSPASSIQSDIYQMSYWYNSFSWWWAHGCPKRVENRNKHTWKRIVRPVRYLQRLHRDARPTEHKIIMLLVFFFTSLLNAHIDNYVVPRPWIKLAENPNLVTNSVFLVAVRLLACVS